MFSAWALLMVAVCTEIAWGCSLKVITFCDFGRWFAAVPVLLSFLNMYLLARVMRELPAGVTYAVWMSLGPWDFWWRAWCFLASGFPRGSSFLQACALRASWA